MPPLPDAYLLIALPVLGLLLGSFLGVVITRGPVIWGLIDAPADAREMSLAWPPSHCPQCDAKLSPLDLIPLLGFAMTRGRCRKCEAPISRLYPTAEALCGLGGVFAALLFADAMSAVAALFFFTLLVGLAAIDHRTGYLPDALTMPLLTLGLASGAGGLFVSADAAILGWVAGWGSLALLAFLYRTVRGREGLGGGDAKLLGAGGAFLGPLALPMVLLVAAAAALLTVAIARRGEVSGADELRFGPWLAGAIALIFVVKSAWPGLLP